LLKVFLLSQPFLSRNTYIFLFSLLGLVYCIGLFVPLMDNDSAHHANIALHMYLTGDYVSLIDYGKDYLDKPHLHFWLAAMSYAVFGITGFAYKFPSFLFTILAIYSTYRIGKALYHAEIGRLAALLLASSFAFILANNDVRMDAILTSCIAFAIWQLIAFIQQKKLIHIAGAALGLALGFSTKGHIAVLVPAIAALFYILYLKEWKLFINWKWLLLIVLFFIFISPVIYSYYLQYNLHPEKVVRGNNHINGVKFILLNQSIERFSGTMGDDAKNDYFFFLHSFLWAFAPWSLLAYFAMADRIKHFLQRKEEWLTTGVFIIILLIVSFSGFKLPHYLNIVFPTTAVVTAAFVIRKKENGKWIRIILIIQSFVSFLLLLLAGIINGWAFPVTSSLVIIGVIIMLATVFYFVKSKMYTTIQKTILIPVATMAFVFFLLNSNFYPKLLTYQAGNVLAMAANKKINPEAVFFWKETVSASFNFYTATTRKTFSDSVLSPAKQVWLLYDIRDEQAIKDAGYKLKPVLASADYEITRLKIKFFTPSKREAVCSQLVIAAISK